MRSRRLAIIGAGPTGLEAALAASAAGWDFTVYEASNGPAGNIADWEHVRLFTPWSMNASPRARDRLVAVGAEVPDGDDCPTGRELIDRLLAPLAALPEIQPHILYGSRVVEISRDGLLKNDEIGTARRAERPFRILIESEAGERIEYADVVLDCSGSYGHPHPLGIGGIHAPGERQFADRVCHRIPDLSREADEWAGRRILLIGAGASGQTAARDLAELVRARPNTSVVWAVRDRDPTFGAIPDDPLPARAALAASASALVSDPASPIDARLGCTVDALSDVGDGIRVVLRCGGDGGVDEAAEVVVDRILALTGSVGDASMYRQLQIHECWATSGVMKLSAALLASSSVDCLDQTGQGADTLRNPEPDFYILGSKSYGRNNTFLLRVGWEQVDEVFSLLGTATAEVRGSA
jgi:Pyridine nucleotide-disulphide oxidoreductase